jgi:hypothetical protein
MFRTQFYFPNKYNFEIFSKRFGGKEFYMSFDKMNQFVEEHTVLMREFLRNISTLNNDDLAELNESTNSTNRLNKSAQTAVLPIVTLTPQTPNMQLKDTEQPINREQNYELEIIDLGKQLSILHSLLVSILTGLDEVRLISITLLDRLGYLISYQNIKHHRRCNEDHYMINHNK